MSSINLLPVDLSPNKGLGKLSRILKRVAIVGATLLILIVSSLTAWLLILTATVKTEREREDQLKVNILGLQEVEQKFFLVRDRLSKVQIALKETGLEENIDKFENLMTEIPEGVEIYDVEINDIRTKLTFVSSDSLALSKFLSDLVVNDHYEQVNLKSFSFSPNSGYLLLIEAL